MWNLYACGLVAGTIMMGSVAFAQQAGRAADAQPELSPTAAATQHLVRTHAVIALFDHDRDGWLDATERDDLAARLDDGTWTVVPFGARPTASPPPTAVLLAHIDWVYTMTTPFDVDHDGTLDAPEQRALEAGVACLVVPPWLRSATECAGVPGWNPASRGWRPWGPPWR